MVKLDIVTYYHSGARNSFVRQKNPVELYIVCSVMGSEQAHTSQQR